MSEADTRQAELLGELEEIVSQLAQQTDSKTTNLQVYIEEQKKLLDERDHRRWMWFLGISVSILLTLGVLSIEMWERQYDRIACIDKAFVKIDSSLDNLKAQIEELKSRNAGSEQRDQEITLSIKRLDKAILEISKRQK